MTAMIPNEKVTEAAETELEKAVAKWLTDRADEYDTGVTGVFRDLFYGGCESGIVGELVYYKDSVPFAVKHVEDILQLATEQAEELGDRDDNALSFLGRVAQKHNLGSADQVLNWLAWYGFEEAARRLADRVGYEE